jgi:hypothetical protein
MKRPFDNVILAMAMVLGLFQVLPGAAIAQSLEGPARSAVLRALDSEERANLLPGSRITYGDFTGDGRPDAVAIVYFGFEGGNGFGLTTLLLENTPGGFAVISRPDGVAGQSPRNFRFARGRVTFITTTPRPGDPRCCPTGQREWTLDIPLRRATTPATTDGPLARRYCDQVGGSVVYSNRTLIIDAGGLRDRFRNVTFEGCTGNRCSYLQEATDLVWTVIVRPGGLSMRGPTSAVGLRPVDLEFGTCR